MSNLKVSELKSLPIRLLKPFLDSRGNLYLAKDYAPYELPEQVIEKGQVKVISETDESAPFDLEFKTVKNQVPEQKVEVQTRSMNTKKKPTAKPTEVIDLNPIEAVNPTK
jgi:hypothetical protein